jgi:hypothetical protein
MICADGGRVLLAASPIGYPGIPEQRCWAHKIGTVPGEFRKPDYAAVKADLHVVTNAKNRPQARSAARRFADRWGSRPTLTPSPACVATSTSCSPGIHRDRRSSPDSADAPSRCNSAATSEPFRSPLGY